MTQCRASYDEEAYDRVNANAEREAIATAKEQLWRVNDAAKAILSGHAIIDTRQRNIHANKKGADEHQRVAVNFSMKNVADLFAEEITTALCVGLHRGEPSAVFAAQKLIGEAAHRVAFDALDLSSAPFVDFNDLKDTAEQ